MNEHDITKYLEKLRTISLSSSVRSDMREKLSKYADFHAYNGDVRKGELVRSIGEEPKGVFIGFIGFKLKYMTALLIALVLIGGGTSYAAQGTVPGDVLYPIKVGVNENVRSAFAVSNTSEAKLQAALVAERLEEAETLAAKGELSSDVSVDLRTRLENHFNSAIEEGNEAQASGDLETSAATRASLTGMFETYADILTRIDAKLGRQDSAQIVSDIRGYATVAADTNASATVSVDNEVQVKALVRQSRDIVQSVRAELDGARAELSAEVESHFNARLDEAVRAESDAEIALSAGRYQDAYTHAQTAIRLAKKLETMIHSSLSLDVNAGINVGDILNIGASSQTKDETSTTTDESNDQNSGTTTNTNVNGSVDVDVDTDVLDVDSNTSVNSNINL